MTEIVPKEKIKISNFVKLYYDQPTVFMLCIFKTDVSDEFVDFIKSVQEAMPKEKISVLINTPEKIKQNMINHCFLVNEQMQIEGWEQYGNRINIRIKITKICNVNKLVDDINKKEDTENEDYTIRFY